MTKGSSNKKLISTTIIATAIIILMSVILNQFIELSSFIDFTFLGIVVVILIYFWKVSKPAKTVTEITMLYGGVSPIIATVIAWIGMIITNDFGWIAYGVYVVSYVAIIGFYHPYVLKKEYLKEPLRTKELVHMTDKAKVAALRATAFMAVVSVIPQFFDANWNYTKMIAPVIVGYAFLRAGIESVMLKGYELDKKRYQD